MAVMAQSPREIAKHIRNVLTTKKGRDCIDVMIGTRIVASLTLDKRSRKIPTFNYWRTALDLHKWAHPTFHATLDKALDHIATEIATTFLMIAPWTEGRISIHDQP